MALPSYLTPLERAWHACLLVICGLIFVFLTAPIFVVMPLSFNSESFFSLPMPGYSLQWYEQVFTHPDWRNAAVNSLVVAISVTLLSTFLGTLAALGLSHADFPLKGWITAVLISPLVVPTVIAGVGLFFFYAMIDLVYSLTGLILAHTVLATPFVVILVTATLTGFDRNQVRAGASLGANPVQVFFRVTMPLIMPGMVSAAILAFVTSFDEVVVALFLAGPEQHTLPRQMWKGVREQLNPAILALSVLLVLVSLAVLLLNEWLRRRSARLRGLQP